MAAAYSTAQGMRKRCPTCRQELELSSFWRAKNTPDGLQVRCRDCAKEAVRRSEQKRIESGLGRLRPETQERRKAARRLQYAENPEKYRAMSRANRASNPEACNRSRAKSKEKKPQHYSDYAKTYYHANKATLQPKHREIARRRSIAERRATPAWANRDAILAVYQLAAQLSEAGKKYHVDHIVPIKSSLVCGLHVEHNLRVMPQRDNQSKGNRVWPGHPDPRLDSDGLR